MQPRFDELHYVVGSPENLELMMDVSPLSPFAGETIAFLNDLSIELRNTREYPDIATFGFWCRKAALLKEKQAYDDLSKRLGRGIAFHSTPSNVPVNFAFSFAAGLLAGNANIVRLPGRNFDQVKVICDAIRALLKTRYQPLVPYVVFVKYPPKKEITDMFSALCNIRVVWGGDATIAEMRRSPLPARSTEITFADRYSIAVIDADAYLSAVEKDRIALGFYNDTYLNDQNACTSPRIVFWKGHQIKEAKADFWARVHDLVSKRYSLAPVQSVGKLNAAYSVAMQKNVRIVQSKDMLVTRVETSCANSDLMSYAYHSGFFFEMDIDKLEEIVDVCGVKCQTLTYFGLDENDFRIFFEKTRPMGVDRIVPIGKSMDFSLVWDGHDLIREMSRKMMVI